MNHQFTVGQLVRFRPGKGDFTNGNRWDNENDDYISGFDKAAVHEVTRLSDMSRCVYLDHKSDTPVDPARLMPVPDTANDFDPELQAIDTIIKALTAMRGGSITRVLDYVNSRF
jgi:hypothetical protein